MTEDGEEEGMEGMKGVGGGGGHEGAREGGPCHFVRHSFGIGAPGERGHGMVCPQ